MNNNRIKKYRTCFSQFNFLRNYTVVFDFSNLLKDSEILITHVRYNYRGVCNIPYQKREEVYNRSLFPITEVRRFPYNTQGLATNLANPNLAYYSRILGVMIKQSITTISRQTNITKKFN